MHAAPPHRNRFAHPRGVLLGTALSLALVLAACDIPTELPRWDTTWAVPAETTTFDATTILPASVATMPGGNAFHFSVAPISWSRTLGQMCGTTCSTLNGQTAPKPPFTSTFSSSMELPADMISAAVISGEVHIRIAHDLGFDPIRPSTVARGYILLSAVSGGTILVRDSIAGESLAFPSGTQLVRSLSLPGGTLSGPVTIHVEVGSPLGDLVQINTARGLTVTATPENVQIAQAQIRVTDRFVTGNEGELDLARFDSAITDRIKSGALMLELRNPFSISGTLDMKVAAAGSVLTRRVQLEAGESSARIEFTAQEMREILGTRPVVLNVTGTVSTPEGGTGVLPGQVLTIRSRLELILGAKDN